MENTMKALNSYLENAEMTPDVLMAMEEAHTYLAGSGYRDVLLSAAATAAEIQEDIECFLAFMEAGTLALA